MPNRGISETLAGWLARVERVPETVAADLARGIARALAAAHAAGVVHGDLRPEHVFVTFRDGRPRLFGIRRRMHARELSRYSAPELTRAGGVVDGRADLYSLGCILRDMVGAQPHDLALAIVIDRLVAPSPGDRFTSAGELLDALGAPRRFLWVPRRAWWSRFLPASAS